MLSGLTLYLENHDQLLNAGILPALMSTVQDEHTVPQVHASDCTMHLAWRRVQVLRHLGCRYAMWPWGLQQT